MTGMLVVRELYPESWRLNEVPVSHLGRLLFQQMASSDLQIFDATKEVGYLHFQPKIAEGSAERVLEFNGSVNLTIPEIGAHHFSWIGHAMFDAKLRLLRLQFSVASSEPGGQLEVALDPLANTASYAVREGRQLGESVTFTMDEKGVAALLEKLGVPRALLAQLHTQTSAMPAPAITAEESTLKLNGEKITTYLFSVKIEDQVLLDADLGQIGQILRARIPLLHYRLAPAGIMP
jgi:hypothetical protein